MGAEKLQINSKFAPKPHFTSFFRIGNEVDNIKEVLIFMASACY